MCCLAHCFVLVVFDVFSHSKHCMSSRHKSFDVVNPFVCLFVCLCVNCKNVFASIVLANAIVYTWKCCGLFFRGQFLNLLLLHKLADVAVNMYEAFKMT